MKLSKRSFIIILLAWLTSIILLSLIAASLYLELQREKQNLTELLEKYQSCVMQVNICIDYCEWNGTIVWYNDIIVPLGCNLLEATKIVATVNYTYWEAYHASFVDAINGIWNQGKYYWMWYRWNSESQTWEYGECGADLYVISNGETLKWRYEIPNYS